MNDFDVIDQHLTRSKVLRNEVEDKEKTNFNTINNKTLIIKSIQISIGEKSEPEDRCKSINVLYLVNQKRLVREVIYNLNPNQARNLIITMIDTPPIGTKFEKMVNNRNMWIDELIWYLTTKYSKNIESLDDIVDSIGNYKYHLDSSLNLRGVVDLFIDKDENSQ